MIFYYVLKREINKRHPLRSGKREKPNPTTNSSLTHQTHPNPFQMQPEPTTYHIDGQSLLPVDPGHTRNKVHDKATVDSGSLLNTSLIRGDKW